jgi:hypothetical protein
MFKIDPAGKRATGSQVGQQAAWLNSSMLEKWTPNCMIGNPL